MPSAGLSPGPSLVHFARGELVLREGEPGAGMYIVAEGRLEVFRGHGAAERRLRLLAKGDFFGEAVVLDAGRHEASVRTLTDCRLLAVERSVFPELVEEDREIVLAMLRKLTRRARELEDRLGVLEDELEARDGDKAATPASTVTAEEAPPEPPPQAGGRIVVVASGQELALLHDRMSVGRRDPASGAVPDLDLSPFDTRLSLSRRHAEILRVGGKLLVQEGAKTANGTFVNGRRLETGVPVGLKDGDELRFGLVDAVVRIP